MFLSQLIAARSNVHYALQYVRARMVGDRVGYPLCRGKVEIQGLPASEHSCNCERFVVFGAFTLIAGNFDDG